MMDTDFVTFDRAFRRLSGAFRLKLKPVEMEELTRTYFKVFEHAPLDDVLAAAKVCVSKCRTFPKPVEWLDALPNKAVVEASALDVRVMGVDEAEIYLQAERFRYETDPCSCLLCQAAGATNLPLRFVPDCTDDDRVEHAFCPPKNRIVVTGHWAHGDELVRWYAARDAFYRCVPRQSPMARALAVLINEREPGEEG